MRDLSRRKLLLAGGAMGALGVIGQAAPARAWTWSPAGSVAGAGAGADPRWVWDDLADPVIAEVIKKGQVEQVNALLRTWTRNDQAIPDEMPRKVRGFMEEARQLPSWVDHDQLATAFEFNKKRGLYVSACYGMASGMMSTVIPREARAVYYSQGGADMKDRIAKTAKLGNDIGTRDAYSPGGEMIVTAVKTRMVHAAVRHLLPQSPHWTEEADEEIPISQADIMVTWHSLATTVWGKLMEWEIPIPQQEAEAYLHNWQVTAHMLGVDDEYIPGSWAEADSQAQQVLDPILAPTPEGINLADILVNLMYELDGTLLTRPLIEALTRFMLGDQIADWLELPQRPVLTTTVKAAWPIFIKVREGLLPFWMAPELYWAFDEFLRRFVLFYLGEAQAISIEIPDTNRPT